MTDLPDELSTDEIIRSLASGAPTTWFRSTGTEAALPDLGDVMDSAAARFDRFAPWFAETFPETATVPAELASAFPDVSGGLIESALVPAPAAQHRLDGLFGSELGGRLWLKRDDSLPVSGSIKARGGFHEVLEFAEAVAAEHGLDALDPATYSTHEFREIAANHCIVVGSTGNLGRKSIKGKCGLADTVDPPPRWSIACLGAQDRAQQRPDRARFPHHRLGLKRILRSLSKGRPVHS